MCPEFPASAAPLDEAGYVQSFRHADLGEACQFFDQHGFVVIQDVFENSDLVERLTDEMWETPELRKVPRDNPEAWLKHVNWADVFCSRYNERKGFLGFSPAVGPAAFEVRGNQILHRVFATLMGCSNQLWFKYDRFGFQRPTKVVLPDGSIVEKEEWKTQSNWIHWDQNPWLEPDFARVQGLLALSDHTATSGGFHCIPGWHMHMTSWASSHPPDKPQEGCLIDFTDETAKASIQRITMRRGSFLIWDSRLPHGNWPNEGSTFRQVFYLTFFPAQVATEKDRLMRELEFDSLKGRNPGLASLSQSALRVSGAEQGPSQGGDGGPWPVLDLVEGRMGIRLDSVFNRQQWGLGDSDT